MGTQKFRGVTGRGRRQPISDAGACTQASCTEALNAGKLKSCHRPAGGTTLWRSESDMEQKFNARFTEAPCRGVYIQILRAQLYVEPLRHSPRVSHRSRHGILYRLFMSTRKRRKLEVRFVTVGTRGSTVLKPDWSQSARETRTSTQDGADAAAMDSVSARRHSCCALDRHTDSLRAACCGDSSDSVTERR